MKENEPSKKSFIETAKDFTSDEAGKIAVGVVIGAGILTAFWGGKSGRAQVVFRKMTASVSQQRPTTTSLDNVKAVKNLNGIATGCGNGAETTLNNVIAGENLTAIAQDFRGKSGNNFRPPR